MLTQLLDPAAKLATARMPNSGAASPSLRDTLGFGGVAACGIYATLYRLGSEQDFIGASLTAVVSRTAGWRYDVTLVYLEGR